MRSIVIKIARNTVFANIVLVLILAAGLMAVNTMKRELFPDFSLDEIRIEVPYPGATPGEVEQGIVLKIEAALEGTEGIAHYHTWSHDNRAEAEVVVKHGVSPSDLMDRIRTRINAISTFPPGAEKPVITEEIHRTEVLKLYLSGTIPEARLKESARKIRDRLRMLEGVSQIELLGTRAYEIHVEVSEERLRAHGLSLENIARRIAQSNLDLSAGKIRTSARDIRVRFLGAKYTGRDLRSVVLATRADGSVLTLDRVARIRDGFSDASTMVRVNGRPAVVLEIYKTGQEDALAIARTVTAFTEKEAAALPAGLTLETLYDHTGALQARIDLLVKNGIMGLCLVLILLWLCLDPRTGFWVGMGIPVSLFGALVVVWSMGGSINMLSLFGLIMVLGILVDDAIVVGEAVFHHARKGLSPLEAAAQGVEEVGMPVTVSIVTTILAFLPLAFIGDAIGKLLSILPMVVIPCLVISLVESLFLLPAHLARGFGGKAGARGYGRPTRFSRSIDRWARHRYCPLLAGALTHRYLCLAGAISLFCLSMGPVLGGLVRFEVLPDTGSPLIFSSLKMAPGTSAARTRDAVLRIESALLQALETHPELSSIKNRMAVVGTTLGEDPDTGDHTGGVQVVLEENPALAAKKLLNLWEKAVPTIPGLDAIRFDLMTEGPPGEPIDIWIRGEDPDALTDAAHELVRALGRIEGVGRIRSDAAARVAERVVTPRPGAGFLGITPQDLARQVRGAFHGWEALRVQRGRDDLRIRVRYPEKARTTPSTLDRMDILTPQGYRVPLDAVAFISFSHQRDVIRRVDGRACLRIQAGVDQTKSSAEKIIPMLQNGVVSRLCQTYPDLGISFEGDEKHMKDALGALYTGFPLAVLGIFALVATLFRSYAQPLVILFSIPLGFAGVVPGHLIMGFPLCLMSIFGMVALSGIVVNDAIMLIHRINMNLGQGIPFMAAVESAGRRRFRPIILTTLSTLGGLAPLLLENSSQARFIIPMAISVSAGMISGTLFTLIIIPCLFMILNDLNRLIHGLWAGIRPGREAVEPAGAGISSRSGIYHDSGPASGLIPDPDTTRANNREAKMSTCKIKGNAVGNP